MGAFLNLTRRNIKLFFKDKGMFFTSLITPMILLVLYATFLGNVYRDSFLGSLEQAGVTVPDSLINGTVGTQLLSSLLAVSCVTVAFCSNILMAQDKVTGARRDLTVTPVRRSTLALGYYVSSALTSLIICTVTLGAGLIYLASMDWYLSATEILLVFSDVCLLVLFGTALSSLVVYFVSTQGQISAVGTVVSAGYGFICGAYMPISQYGESLQKVLSFLPGTYCTSLIRNHVMNGVFEEMSEQGFPAEVVNGIRESVDCRVFFFGNEVTVETMYLIVAGSVLLLVGGYVLLNLADRRKK